MARFQNLAATGTIDLTNTEKGSYVKLLNVVVGTGAVAAVATLTDGDAAGISVIDATAKGYYEFEGALCHRGIKLVLSGGNANVTLVYE